jgi:parallel beta-helix repeat protein
MLELHGPGSSVTNMIIDGSITPQPGDESVSRIDWDSDDNTDFWLFSEVDERGDDRLLIAGGIFVQLPDYGPVTISDNELRYFSGNALQARLTAYATISNNLLTAGIYEGILLADGALATISNNTVSGFRAGISVQQMSTITLEENDSSGNRDSGIQVFGVSNEFGDNVIADNHVVGNENSGMTLAAVGYTMISGNRVNANRPHGIDIKSLDFHDGNGPIPSGYINLIENEITDNGTDPLSHGGIRIAEGSGYNSVTGNKVHSNSGFGIAIDFAFLNSVEDNMVRDSAFAGIVLMNGSQGNTIAANKVEKVGYTVEENGFGILSFSTNGAYPSYNTIENNNLSNNSEADIEDQFEYCANSWTNNKFRTENGPDDCMN